MLGSLCTKCSFPSVVVYRIIVDCDAVCIGYTRRTTVNKWKWLHELIMSSDRILTQT